MDTSSEGVSSQMLTLTMEPEEAPSSLRAALGTTLRLDLWAGCGRQHVCCRRSRCQAASTHAGVVEIALEFTIELGAGARTEVEAPGLLQQGEWDEKEVSASQRSITLHD